MQYFYGPDTYGAREAIAALAKEQNLPIRWIDREDIERSSLETIIDESSSGLFGGFLVVVRDPSSFPKSLQEGVVEFIKERAPRRSSSSAGQTIPWIVWDQENPDKRSKLFLALKKYGTAFPELAPHEAVSWVAKEFPVVEQAATRELVSRCGVDRWRLRNEIERLALTNNPVTLKVVQEHVPAVDASDEIFPFLDALAAGSAPRALTLLEGLILSGNSELYILSMLGYQYKTLLAITAGKTEGLHPFVVEKNTPAAKRYSVASLQNILMRLAATDFAIKQGKVDQRTALIMLVLNLVQAPVRPTRLTQGRSEELEERQARG